MKLWSIKIDGEQIRTAEDLAIKLSHGEYRQIEVVYGEELNLKSWNLRAYLKSIEKSKTGIRFNTSALSWEDPQPCAQAEEEYSECTRVFFKIFEDIQPFDMKIVIGKFEELVQEGPETKDLKTLMDDVTKSNRYAKRVRPYDGQSHTDEGERGKTLVEGLTLRDVCDCMAMGMLDASGIRELQDAAEKGGWMYDDLYKLEDFDPVAAIQNMACRIEMMMGIFPNVPKFEFENFETQLKRVDRWKAKDPSDELKGCHVKVDNWTSELITFSWYSENRALGDVLSWDEFKKRFEPWY
jgi:hypothetical protein